MIIFLVLRFPMAEKHPGQSLRKGGMTSPVYSIQSVKKSDPG